MISKFIQKIRGEVLKARCLNVVTHDRIDIASVPSPSSNDDWYQKEKARLEQEEKNTK